MSWLELSLDATAEAIDWIATLLGETGQIDHIRIVQEPVDQQLAQPWPYTAYFYLVNNSQAHRRTEAIAQRLASLERTGLTTALQIAIVEAIPPTDAAAQPMHRIGQHFVLLPPNAIYTPQSKSDLLLRLKPSLAFGSGLHPATIASLQLLEQSVQSGMQTLDLGCGSGILSLAMAKLGATVLALDNDPVAVAATQETIQLNQVESQVTVQVGSLGCGSQMGHWMGGNLPESVPSVPLANQFDLIMANILARIHGALANDYRQALRSSGSQLGLLITAGYTTDLAQEVEASLATAGFTAIANLQLDEWIAQVHQLSH